MEDAARRLARLGADRLPVLAVGSQLFAGEERMGEAVLAARAAVPTTRAG
jgi:hypothetical protein